MNKSFQNIAFKFRRYFVNNLYFRLLLRTIESLQEVGRFAVVELMKQKFFATTYNKYVRHQCDELQMLAA